MTVSALQDALDRATSRLIPCCGTRVRLRYVPGCTYVECPRCGRKVTRPDWDPQGASLSWNNKILTHRRRQDQAL